MNLIVDIGNTRAKIAVFDSDIIQSSLVFDDVHSIDQLGVILKEYKVKSCIVSSVRKINQNHLNYLRKIPFLMVLNPLTKVPFRNLYATPKTLGVDRIALVAASVAKFPQKNSLIIDAGTCITYDFVNSNNEYLGGAISPGIEIRYQSLNNYTSKLPKLEKSETFPLIGQSTSESIHAGVIGGIISEIESMIKQYQENFDDLTLVLTGGDAIFLSKQLKNEIFTSQNFLLHGLNKILTFNNH